MGVGDVKPFRPDGCKLCGTRLGESCVHVRPSIAENSLVWDVSCEHCAVPAGTPCPYPIGYCADRLSALHARKQAAGPGAIQAIREEFTVEVWWAEGFEPLMNGPFSRESAEKFAVAVASNPGFRRAQILEGNLRAVPQ